MQDKKVIVGTSGYSYSDWIGVVYPVGTRKNRMLDEYSKIFKTTEINSSFYSPLGLKAYMSIANRTPPDFSFFIKAHKSITHERKGTGEFLKTIKELPQKTKKFLGVLVQFPFSFKLNRSNLDYLKGILKEFKDFGIPTATEFRHSSWYVKGVAEVLKGFSSSFVAVDEPELENLPPKTITITNPEFSYIRFHSRDSKKWWKGDKERYDYLYSHDELKEWIPKIQRTIKKVKAVFVYFNNCQRGYAAKNAIEFREMLRKEGINAY